MSTYTRVGAGLWSWDPFVDLPPTARCLWLALYTSHEAKRIVPGLFHGSIRSMGEAAHLPADETLHALEAMRDREMIEFDPKLRVLRLAMLPDAGESPANGRVIRSWWGRFQTVPACGVRDAHITTLRWIMDAWSRESGKPVSADHETAWRETFGQVAIPKSRRRGVRSLLDSDTSTALQPSLFGSPSVPSEGPDTVSATVSSSGYVARPVDNSETERKEPSGYGIGYRQDQDQDLGSGSFSPEGGSGGRPVLSLVPPVPGPFTVGELAALCTGARWPKTLGEPISSQLARAIGSLPATADLSLLADYVAHDGLIGCTPEHLATPGALAGAFAKAAMWRKDAQERIDAMAALRAKLGPT